ncbi:MAG TPA: tetratricopeptide repeat protein [Chloroflexota bacterium]|nr:tetratricopeptide repeat protein [Chloroflexota bacterium]
MGLLDKLLGGLGGSPANPNRKKAESLNKKALQAVSQNRLDEAEGLLLEAIKVEPSLSAAHHNLGALYLNQRRFAQASKCIRRAIQLDPNDVESRIALAKVLSDMGKADEAFADYEWVCKQYPDDWRAQISYGNALLEKERLDEAIEHLEKAVILRSKEELTHLVLAAAYERRGDLEKAIKQYKAARGATKVNQNRAAASRKMHELQLRAAEQRRAQSQRG